MEPLKLTWHEVFKKICEANLPRIPISFNINYEEDMSSR